MNMAAPDTIDERVINTGKNISIFKVRKHSSIVYNNYDLCCVV